PAGVPPASGELTSVFEQLAGFGGLTGAGDQVRLGHEEVRHGVVGSGLVGVDGGAGAAQVGGGFGEGQPGGVGAGGGHRPGDGTVGPVEGDGGGEMAGDLTGIGAGPRREERTELSVELSLTGGGKVGLDGLAEQVVSEARETVGVDDQDPSRRGAFEAVDGCVLVEVGGAGDD